MSFWGAFIGALLPSIILVAVAIDIRRIVLNGMKTMISGFHDMKRIAEERNESN